MTNARRARWSGALVSDHGRVVLLRGTTGTLFYPDPQAAAAGSSTAVLYSDGTAVLYSDATAVGYNT